MMSRNRPTGPGTRVYLRATTNPGGAVSYTHLTLPTICSV